MDHIKNISDFDLVNESILYFSPILRSQLEHILKLHDSDIAKSLLSLEGQDLSTDLTFVDIGESGFLSFTQMQPAIKRIRSIYPDALNGGLDTNYQQSASDTLYNNDKSGHMPTGIFTKSRNQIRIGKFIKNLLGSKYTTQQIEEFVNSVKSAQNDDVISVVSGKDIEFWYDSSNSLLTTGTLGSSCMNKIKGVFDIYTTNPECRLVIMTRCGKLVARALLWKLISPILGDVEYFMDRVYYNNDYQSNQMREYADSQGWAYRWYDSFGMADAIGYKGKVHLSVKMSVKIKNIDYKKFPYLDTFRMYVPRTGMLYNHVDYFIVGYILDGTDGGFSKTGAKETRLRRFLDFLNIQ